MSFIPGLLVGVMITLYRKKIVAWFRKLRKWLGSKPWLRVFYYHRLKWRILNKNDVRKKILVYYHENNYLSSKQYKKLYEIHRRMRKLKLIISTSTPSKKQDKSKSPLCEDG